MNIGFIGLGNMGAGMAHNLLMPCKDSDDTLIVLDINETVLADFVAKGAINGETAVSYTDPPSPRGLSTSRMPSSA